MQKYKAGRNSGIPAHRDLKNQLYTYIFVPICSGIYRPIPNISSIPQLMALDFSFDFLESATETLRAVAHPQRLQIVAMLHEKKVLNVTEIYEALQIEQAVASHHLRILKDRGVVQVRRDGKNSNYALTNEGYYRLIEILQSIV